MEYYVEVGKQWLNEALRHAWAWFAHLDRQEWVMVMIATTIAGFLCLRGFGSRNQY